jgi:hypothetical protein
MFAATAEDLLGFDAPAPMEMVRYARFVVAEPAMQEALRRMDITSKPDTADPRPHSADARPIHRMMLR